MWRICGQIEEKTKLAAWLAFERMRKKLWLPDGVEAIDATELSLLFPRNKTQAFQSMVKNADDSGWILPYQFESSSALRSHTHRHTVAMQQYSREDTVDPYCADGYNKATVHHDRRGMALHGNLHDNDLLGDCPHLLSRRVRQLPALLVPPRDPTQYACREYYGDTPYALQEVSEAAIITAEKVTELLQS